MRVLLMLGAVSVIALTAGCQKGGQKTQQAAPPAQQMQPAPAPTSDTGMKADTTMKAGTTMKDTSTMKHDSMMKDTSGM